MITFTQFSQSPFHKLQILTWCLFPLFILHFFAFLYPLLWDYTVVKVLVTFFFLLSSTICVYSAYMCCAIDPADDALKMEPLSDGSTWQADSVYCYICEVNVHKCSKHCRYCDKCVERLDHHCKWLNTCVGSKNYMHFLSTIMAVGVMTTILLLLSLAYLVEAFAHREMFEQRFVISKFTRNSFARTSSLQLPPDGVRAVVIISVIFLSPLVALIYQLAVFHFVLRKLYYLIAFLSFLSETCMFFISRSFSLHDIYSNSLQRYYNA